MIWALFRKSKLTNTDGGPPTAVCSFDRDRERQMAEQYSRGRQDWLQARYALIDQVLQYRADGVLTHEFLDACEAEFRVAQFACSNGIRRLVELAADGHEEPAARLEELLNSKRWRERYASFQAMFAYSGDSKKRRELVRRALADASARIRTLMAKEAAFAHLIDMASELETAAAREPNARHARSIFWVVYYMRANEKTGKRNSLGGGEADHAAQEAAWTRFAASRRSQTPE